MSEAHQLGLLLGDGIGPEIVVAARRVVDAALATMGASPVRWHELPMGAQALADVGEPLPTTTVESLGRCEGWLCGPHDSASYPPQWHRRHERTPGGELRHRFDLYANVRPSRTRAGIASVVPHVDLVIVRENTEGLYADRSMHEGSGELRPTEDLVLTVGVFSRTATRRIATYAYALARRRRSRVTIVHKANALPAAFGLFVEECHRVAAEFPDVETDDCLVDAMTAYLVREPERFDVVVTENLCGDVLSELAGELVGSVGAAGSLNAGDEHAMAQAAHGAAPSLAGLDVANPLGMITSAALLLAWLGRRHDDPLLSGAATRIDDAVDAVVAQRVLTPDVGGDATTTRLTDAVCHALAGP